MRCSLQGCNEDSCICASLHSECYGHKQAQEVTGLLFVERLLAGRTLYCRVWPFLDGSNKLHLIQGHLFGNRVLDMPYPAVDELAPLDLQRPEGALKGFADKCKLREKFANKADREWTSLLLDETGTRRREGGLAPFLTPKLIHSFIERVYERQIELSAGTYKLVELYSERIMEKYAENEFKKTKFGQAFQLQVTD